MLENGVLVEDFERHTSWFKNVKGWRFGGGMMKDGVLVEEC